MAEYSIYKLKFQTAVHFGNGMLNASAPLFCADTLFSALFIEALKLGYAEDLLQAVKQGRLKISDAFPYAGDQFFVPKPMIRVRRETEGDSIVKKQFKAMKYLPVEELDAYLAGTLEPEDLLKGHFVLSTRAMAAVSGQADTLPYQVGVCTFAENAGLYIIAEANSDEEQMLFGKLLDAVSKTGIGGKRSAGLGRFEVRIGKKGTEELCKRLCATSERRTLLSVALPREEEPEAALEDASYSVLQRSGFVSSDTFAPEQRKKRTLFVLEAGSCFHHLFSGDVYDVSGGSGNHPVYRYAVPMFLAV